MINFVSQKIVGIIKLGDAKISIKKGKPKRVSGNVDRLVVSERREHSRKPDRIRNDIIELCGDLPRIELFARQKTPGWDVWGNEV